MVPRHYLTLYWENIHALTYFLHKCPLLTIMKMFFKINNFFKMSLYTAISELKQQLQIVIYNSVEINGAIDELV